MAAALPIDDSCDLRRDAMLIMSSLVFDDDHLKTITRSNGCVVLLCGREYE